MSFLLRPATPQDLDAIVAIDEAAFTQPWSRASFETALTDGGRSMVLVLEQAGAVRAFGVAWNVAEEGEIATLAVESAARGQGWGETLMRALLQELAARGTQSVFLEVRPSNAAARRLYRRLNFEEVGERPNYYFDGEAAIIMKLQLND